MEKKEARIKCHGCGTSYKIKIPVTDKPVNFKCKKCGKVLKLKVTASPAAEAAGPPPMDREPPGGFETTQLADTKGYQDKVGQPPQAIDLERQYDFAAAAVVGGTVADEEDRKWLVLADDLIKGPFTKAEIEKMIKRGEITLQTSLRMGDRPWVQAGELPDFRGSFPMPRKIPGTVALETISLLGADEPAGKGEAPMAEVPFYKQVPALASYPVAGGKPIPLAIFAGIVFVVSTVLSLDVLIGFPLNIAVWILLYGYLTELMQASMQSPQKPPPELNLADIKQLLGNGLNVFLIILEYLTMPMVLILLGMVYCFLNDEVLVGYVLMGVAVLIYLASALFLPAALVTLCASGNRGAAMKPGRVLSVGREGGQAYRMLALIYLATSLPCVIIKVVGLFLMDELPAGFVLSGLLMAGVFSYAHFVWFHAMGRFAAENKKVVNLA
ncbi:MAG: DUF4013 domain-containing protein [Deltaproteobacteria bacterium]|nr:DUF4013 domain-containing protein [Deltaproteobacteria bacterium]